MYDIVLHVKLIHQGKDCLKVNITEEQCVWQLIKSQYFKHFNV